MLLVYAVAIGLICGVVTRGRIAALGTIHIRLWPVALGGLFFQALLFSSPVAASVGALGPPLYVVSTTLVLLALVANLRLPGFWLISLGALLNLTVIVLNGGQMPAAADAVAAVAGSGWQPSGFVNSLPMDHAHAGLLGDIFVLPRPIPLANVFSVGDLLIGVGGAIFVFRTMHSAPLIHVASRAAVPAKHA